jgi:hypothetical protein
LRHGWHIAVGYVIGFFVLLAVLGWQPQDKRVRAGAERPAASHTLTPT